MAREAYAAKDNTTSDDEPWWQRASVGQTSQAERHNVTSEGDTSYAWWKAPISHQLDNVGSAFDALNIASVQGGDGDGEHGGYSGGYGGGNGGGDGGKLVGYSGDSSDSDTDAKELQGAQTKFFDVLNAFTNKRLAEEARAERIEELAKDPAKGGTADDKTRREAEVALQLEEIGKLAGPIIRDPSGCAEFIDRRGTLWDVKQFHSEEGHFNLGKAVGKIKGEILAGENVILDTKFLDPNDAADLRSAIETNGWQRKILWSKDE